MVKDIGISPPDAWNLDFAEVTNLIDKPEKDDQDLSLMLNFERVKNGAPKSFMGWK